MQPGEGGQDIGIEHRLEGELDSRLDDRHAAHLRIVDGKVLFRLELVVQPYQAVFVADPLDDPRRRQPVLRGEPAFFEKMAERFPVPVDPGEIGLGLADLAANPHEVALEAGTHCRHILLPGDEEREKDRDEGEVAAEKQPERVVAAIEGEETVPE